MSCGAIVLPSINRYLSRVVAQSLSGIIAYGCRYNIHLVDANSTPIVLLDSKSISEAHKGKIISLAFSKSEENELLASTSDDLQLKVWDVETQTCIASMDVNDTIFITEWIHGSSTTLVFPTERKILLKWNVVTNVKVKIKTGCDIPISAISSNPQMPHLMAIGHNTGSITLIDIVQENVVQKLKSHLTEITNLSWSLLEPDILVSTSADFNIRMWKKDTEKPLGTYIFPTSFRKHDDKEKKKSKVLAICHPRIPNVAICCNLKGDIGEINFSEEKPKFMIYYQPNYELSCKSAVALFTSVRKTSQGERDVLHCVDPFKFSSWDLVEKKMLSHNPFLIGFVYDLSPSNVNPNLLAICNGDGIVRVCNSQAEKGQTHMSSIYVHYKSKIMTAAFHPTHENTLAYGTDEGRVGMIDLYRRKLSFAYETHHTDAVYSLSWGPCEKASNAETDAMYFIYSCGGGVLYINPENNSKAETLNFDQMIERPPDLDSSERAHSEVCWKSDYSCLCIGSFKGFIDLYDAKFTFLARLNVQMKSVECLRWHPESTFMSPAGSPYKFWMACGGSGSDISIYDTSKILENKESHSDGALKSLIGHKNRIYSLSWSQHDDGHLASSSKDGTVLVWDVCAGTILATYMGHQTIVQAVYWSVFDKDVIYSGGLDSSVRVWRISNQSVQAPPDKILKRKIMRKPPPKPKGRKKQEMIEDDEFKNGSDESKIDKSSDVIETSPVVVKTSPKITTGIFEEACDVSNISNRSLEIGSVSKKSGGLFPQYAELPKGRNDEELLDCIKLAELQSLKQLNCDESQDVGHIGTSSLTETEVAKLGFFADQCTAIKMIESQAELHRSVGANTYADQLSLMISNTNILLTEAAAQGRLTSSLVSYAPSVSYKFWLEMCEKYAFQLLEDHNPYKASTYFLMAGNVYQAIHVLADKGNVLDALALAKARLPETDPLIQKLLSKTAKKFSSAAFVTGQAKCSLAMNEPLRAAKLLASTSDQSCIRAASIICKKFALHKEAEDYQFLCIERCLIGHDWTFLNLLTQQDPQVEVYKSFFAVHEVLCNHLQTLKKQDRVMVREILSSHDSCAEVMFWNGHSCVESEQSFIDFVSTMLASKGLLQWEKSSVENVLHALDSFSAKRTTSDAKSLAHITIAIYITKFILLCAIDDFKNATHNFIKIFEASHNIVHLPRVICSLLLPISLHGCKSTNKITYKYITEKSNEQDVNKIAALYDEIRSFVCENLAAFDNQSPLSHLFSLEDLKNNPFSIAKENALILSRGNDAACIVLYLMSSIMNDMERLICKKDIKFKCWANQPCEEKNVKVENNVNDTENQDSIRIISEIADAVSVENGSVDPIINDDVDDELQRIIQCALQEADEKANSFRANESSSSCDTSAHLMGEDNGDEHSKNRKELSNLPISLDEAICLSANDKEGILSTISEEIVNDLKVESSETVDNGKVDVLKEKSVDPHSQCLCDMDLFYHVMRFVTFNTCKDEFALLYFLKERLKVLNLNRASRERAKFARLNQLENGDAEEHNRTSSSTQEAPQTLDESEVETASEKTHEGDNSIENTDPNLVTNTTSNGDLECNAVTNDIKGHSEVTTNSNSCANAHEHGDGEVSGKEEVILDLDRQMSQVCLSPGKSESSPKADADAISLSESNITDASICDLDEDILQQSISCLQKAEHALYPSPFDVIPKVLSVLHNMMQEVECIVVREKLHGLIDEVVEWSQMFAAGNINFVCKICQP